MVYRVSRVALIVAVLCALPLVAAEVSSVRVFYLGDTSVSVMEASNAILPLLSERGSITLHPHQGRLIAQDSPEVMQRINVLMEELTRAPQAYRIRIDLLEATNDPVPVGERSEVSQHVRQKFPFTYYRMLGTTVLVGELRGPAQANLGRNHQVGIVVRPVHLEQNAPWGVYNPGSRVHLQEVRLLQRQVRDGRASQVELLRTRAVLGQGQRAIFGVSGSEGAERALIMILEVQAVGDT